MPSPDDLSDMTRSELRAIAAERSIPRASSMKKADLIEAIARDDRWKALKRAVLEKQAESLDIPRSRELTKPELIRQLHRAQSKVQAANDAALEPGPTPAVEESSPSGTRPLLGRFLQIAGLVGIVLAVISAVLFPVVALWASPRLMEGAESTARELRELSLLLDSSRLALDRASLALEGASEGLQTTQATLDNSEPLLSSISELLGSQAPETIRSTRSALQGAQEGARAMDTVLRGLALIGLRYNPEVPLNESLALTAESLDPLPQALIQVHDDIDSVQDDLGALGGDMGLIRTDLRRLSNSLAPLGEDLQTQSGRLLSAADTLDETGASLRSRLVVVGLLGSLLAIWVGLGQTGLLVLGGWLREGVPVQTDR